MVAMSGALRNPTFQNHTMISFEAPPGSGSVFINVIVDALNSDGITFKYDSSVIQSIMPPSAPTQGGTLMVLRGQVSFCGPCFSCYVTRLRSQNFGSTGLVRFGPGQCNVVSYNDTVITCTLPTGQGMQPVTVTVGSKESEPYYWNYSMYAVHFVISHR